MKFINLTAHTINEVITGLQIKPSGIVARVAQVTDTVAMHNGTPIYSTEFGDLLGLPEPREGIVYIVSAMALNGVPAHRTDVVSPGNLKRDEAGQPVGCVGFRVK